MNFIDIPTNLRKFSFSLFFLFALISSSFGQNPITIENALTGTAQTAWDAGDNAPIEGFAQEFSVNKGETVHFKIDVESPTLLPYTVKIYRLGWYQGKGARFIADLGNSLTGKQQPSYNSEGSTGKVDCNNWAVSTQWIVPSTAVSGVYIARLDCPSLNAKSILLFIVRDDAANSPLLFKTSDATWQAYNNYGGNTFYGATTPVPGFTHATKVSYQRILHLRGDKSNFFNSEYPMIRWLEKNGYNVSYTTDMDMARNASVITPSIHKTILSVGHDEYWSAEQRTKIETARNNGVNIAFFSGNSVYWKTRWEDNYQTLVCYKEGTKGENICGTKCDPMVGVWTGLWRDGCSPTYSTDGCYPEGSLLGQMSWTQSTGSIKVPNTYKNLRFWKHTSIATLGAGQTATLPYGTLGNEWDPEQLVDTYPSHRIILSNTIQSSFIHKMSLYRHSNGALVFSAGTMQWPWGLDDKHDLNTATAPVQPISTDMQQATVNLFHDMGLTAGSLQVNLVAPTAVADVLPPNTTISFPTHNATVPGGSITITGVSADNGGGAVAGVEVSLDNGATWSNATGLENWSYTFSPSGYGTITIKVRAWDDVGNLEVAGSPGSPNCITILLSGPFNYSVFNQTYPVTAPLFFSGTPVELGMKFQSTIPGSITGFRYYKGPGVTGVHTGHLWTSTGTLLASQIFTNETTSGWQSVTLAVPVAIAPNTTYIVSYFTASGDFTREDPFFTQAIVNGFLRGLANGEDGGNGVYAYSSSSTFPTNTSGSSSYFADVIFTSTDATAPQVVSVTPANGSIGIALNIQPTATFDEALDPTTVNTSTVKLTGPGNVNIPGTVTLTGGNVITFIPNTDLAIGTLYTMTLRGGITEPLIKDISENALATSYSWSFTTGGLIAPNVTTQPVSQSTCANSSISFISAATGILTPTVQWEISTDNGFSWSPVLGANSGTYTFTALSTDNNNKYRAVWTNSQGFANSNPATLTVAATITGVITAVNSNICPGVPMQLQLTSASGPAPYTLQINSSIYTGINVGQPFFTFEANETIWPGASTIPNEATVPDNNSVELGVRFQASKNGIIKGIRFYKGSAANGGTHKGSLWSSAGILLATATFTGESTSGWQEVLFTTPVNIIAGTSYIASYFAPQGNYSRNGSYFNTGYSNGNSLTALIDDDAGSAPNGLYMYNGTSTFPSNNSGDPNYWVDVVFSAYTTTTTVFNLTTITASNGCSLTGNPVSSASITVSATVNAGTISGLSPLCISATNNYSSNGDLGGVWSTSNPLVAAVNPASGVVNAVGAGNANITYTVTGCNGTTSAFQVVNVSPNANPGTITGTSPLCIGATAIYSSNGEAGGVWSSSNPLVASVNPTSGLVTALTNGTINIIYTLNTGCNSPLNSSISLTVSPNVITGTVTGASPLCIGATDTYASNGTAGGTWGTTNPAVATVNPTTGFVTALTAGTTNITYTVASGCGSPLSTFKTLTVNSCATIVNLKLYLQGYYTGGGQMQPVLLNQGVGLVATETDTITVELHNSNSPYGIVASKKGVLNTDGTISLSYAPITGSYYIAVLHRNTVQTWSANPVTVGAVPVTYNFSTAATKAFGNNMKQDGSVWLLYTGDLNQDEFIDPFDFGAFDTDSQNGVNGVYVATDFNGDGFVDPFDFQVFDENSQGGVSSVHP